MEIETIYKQDKALSGNMWKLGSNWGTGNPSFYDFIKDKKITIGVHKRKYNIGDLVLICEGHTVQAIARIEEEAIDVTTNPELEKPFNKYNIPYEDWVSYAKAEWYELSPNEVFSYKLQQGIVRIQKQEIINKARQIWTNRDSSKINYKELFSNWLNSTNKEGSQKPTSYIKAIDILIEITNKEIFEEDNLSNLNELYNDLLREQRKQTPGGKYFYPEATSYGANSFYSAAIKSYSEFIAQLPKYQITTPIFSIMPLNIILYGPPGTGKTYNSIDKAVEIVTGSSSSDHESNKKKFDKLRKQGQIEFVTFHQNYSYEDFMVGIRPNVSESTNELSFKKYYGIFYEMAKRARENYENSLKDQQTVSKENWVKKKFEEFINSIRNTLESGNDYQIGTRFPERKVISIVDDIYYQQGGEKGVPRHMDFNDIIYAYIDNTFENKDIQNNSRLTNTARNPGLTQYYVDILKQFKDFTGVYKEQIDAETENNIKLKNFVLIIDEINRANISKVFGELITLLEDDKRLDAANELKITLPNGEKDFGVPPNLYIIGTMNTADKSIALIDIALRRRFELIAFYPNYDLLNQEASELLQKINEKIYELKKSTDFLIGHAYFMKNEPIETTLKNRVIPLLMEYFSGKTDIISTIFDETDWKVEYNTTRFNWTISRQ